MFQQYTDSVVEQALDRDEHNARNVEEYLELRRRTIGIWPSLVLLELHLNIPDEVKRHPDILTLESTCVDLVAIANDIYSYNVE